jgi:hypothetical protein
MEISKVDIYNRADIHHYLNPMMGDDASDEARLDEARKELEEEHLWRCFEVFDEAIKALDGHPDAEAVAWKLMQGWNCHLDDSLTDGKNLYFNDWQISPCESQLFFDHQILPTNFYDVDLLDGLDLCEVHDADPVIRKAHLIKSQKIDKIGEIQLHRLLAAVHADGVKAGIAINQNVVNEAIQKTALGGSK